METTKEVKVDAGRAQINRYVDDIRKEIAAMREGIASFGRIQKATLWILGAILALITIGLPVAKILHWI